MTSPAEVTARRIPVFQMSQAGSSHREIARQLELSRATVARILATPPTQRERLALRVAQAETAVAQAVAAAQAVEAARPAYTMADDETARRWGDALRAAAAQLVSQAGAFADYYPATLADHASRGAS
ncbi:helix-turn-helix domain-containing protein [Streptomyces sp. R33]|uniref:Helix-turn-helix domain-containing protein n=1 Tax=Streptomyces sp. R33 TaxID=3238629 RepID=A0AB39YA18_9ACTN